MIDRIDQNYFCSTLSLEAREQIFGSAPEKTVWLLLEYNQSWGAKAFPESDLADTIKVHIGDYLDSNPAANILFIKQPGQQREGLACFVAITDEHSPRLYEYQLSDYDDLLSLDFAAIVNGEDADHLSSAPLFLVCTNSKRDKCCAKYGISIYNQLRQHTGQRAWQCSHLGGHRFAPTSLFLPHGICYGRIQPDDVATMVAAYRDGHIVLDNLRGRVGYSKPVQAADALLRAQPGLTHIDSVQFVDSRETGPNQWAIQFRVGAEIQNIRLEKTQTDVEIFTSCYNDKTALVETYRLL